MARSRSRLTRLTLTSLGMAVLGLGTLNPPAQAQPRDQPTSRTQPPRRADQARATSTPTAPPASALAAPATAAMAPAAAPTADLSDQIDTLKAKISDKQAALRRAETAKHNPRQALSQLEKLADLHRKLGRLEARRQAKGKSAKALRQTILTLKLANSKRRLTPGQLDQLQAKLAEFKKLADARASRDTQGSANGSKTSGKPNANHADVSQAEADSAKADSSTTESKANPGSKEPGSVERVMRQLMKQRRASPVIEPQRPAEVNPHPSRVGSPLTTNNPSAPDAVTGSAPDAKPPNLLAEGTFIVNRRGRLTRSDGGRILFSFAADDAESPEAPMFMLACRKLQDMEKYVEDHGDDTVFKVSGEVHVYRGANYLMPSMMVVEIDRGNLRN